SGAEVYSAMEASSSDIIVSEIYPASIEGCQDIAIYPQVSGTISEVCVKEGQRVRKGQSLFIIDQVPFQAALNMAQANVKAAEAGVATAKLTYESRQKLYGQKVISEYDLLTSENSYLTAQAQLAQAQAQLVNAENNMKYTRVESPADGVVGTIPYRVGALVSAGMPKPLTTVSDNSRMYVYYSVSEIRLLEMIASHDSMDEVIASLPPVKLKLADGSVYSQPGKVETISGVIDPNTGSVSIRAVFPNRGGLLHSGATGEILIEKTFSDVLVIPCKATFELQDKICVWKVVDGKTSCTFIRTRLSDDGKSYIVTDGLSKGDIIVTEGVGMLREGTEVNPKLD
ncbi:MAG: efflux RND transporter periplasmic adaptor subunit, partial [Candidatus Cryptobacteroides sp.]